MLKSQNFDRRRQNVSKNSTVVLSIMLNSFPSMSLSIHSIVKQKEDKINLNLACLRHVHFHGITAVFFIMPLDFYRLA